MLKYAFSQKHFCTKTLFHKKIFARKHFCTGIIFFYLIFILKYFINLFLLLRLTLTSVDKFCFIFFFYNLLIIKLFLVFLFFWLLNFICFLSFLNFFFVFSCFFTLLTFLFNFFFSSCQNDFRAKLILRLNVSSCKMVFILRFPFIRKSLHAKISLVQIWPFVYILAVPIIYTYIKVTDKRSYLWFVWK